MKMTFRRYGESDPVRLEYIGQIPGIYGIVSAVYDVPVGEAWPLNIVDKCQSQFRPGAFYYLASNSIFDPR